jgi:hypothetical protein
VEDSELKASLERINDRTLWTWGWFFCVVVTLAAIAQIAMDWHLRGSAGKITACSFVLVLIAWPLVVVVAKRNRRLSNGSLFFGAYLLVMTAIAAFGPGAHAN